MHCEALLEMMGHIRSDIRRWDAIVKSKVDSRNLIANDSHKRAMKVEE